MSRSLIRKTQLHPDVSELISQYVGNQVVFVTGNQIVSGEKRFIGNQTISGNLNVSGTLNVGGTLNVSGSIISSRAKTFIYSGTMRGTGNTTGVVAYGANCTITPMYVGTVRADASMGTIMTATDTSNAQNFVSFWYGTGTPPVYSGNLNLRAGSQQIGGNKSSFAIGGASVALAIQPIIDLTWISEITGLRTGTQYWFDVGFSGTRVNVRDLQIYLEEKS